MTLSDPYTRKGTFRCEQPHERLRPRTRLSDTTGRITPHAQRHIHTARRCGLFTGPRTSAFHRPNCLFFRSTTGPDIRSPRGFQPDARSRRLPGGPGTGGRRGLPPCRAGVSESQRLDAAKQVTSKESNSEVTTNETSKAKTKANKQSERMTSKQSNTIQASMMLCCVMRSHDVNQRTQSQTASTNTSIHHSEHDVLC